MNTILPGRVPRALVSPLVAAFFAGAATIAAVGLVLGLAPGTATRNAAEPPAQASVAQDPTATVPEPEACNAEQLVEPGEYESVERAGSALATWVIVPDSLEHSAPARLYVLTVAGFSGATNELDLLRPMFEALDGVVVVTAVKGADDGYATLIGEIEHDFCIDAERVVTSMVPLPTPPVSPKPGPQLPHDTVTNA